MPKRIQRKRVKGWKLPPDAVCVTRPGVFGNPFRVFGRNEYLYCDAGHVRTVLTPWVIFDQDQDIARNPATPEMAVAFFSRWLNGEFDASGVVRPCLCRARLHELRGKDLACFCPLNYPDGSPRPCHADVLLEFANREDK